MISMRKRENPIDAKQPEWYYFPWKVFKRVQRGPKTEQKVKRTLCGRAQSFFMGGSSMHLKSVVMDDKTMKRTLVRMSHEIIERYHGVEDVVLIGIRRRGVPLARTISQIIQQVEDVTIPVGELDITHYRDDLTLVKEKPEIHESVFPFEVTNKRVVLVDDVIYTGRTCRAAIEAVFRKGRPASIALAVMVDRGHRELPIKPDFVGKNIPTSKNEVISVRLREFDGETNVAILERD